MPADMNRREGMTAGQPPKYENYEDGLYKVVGISDKMEKNGALLYECECKSCGKNHLRNAKHLKQQIRSRECDDYRSSNWSGLERNDAIMRRKYGITQAEYDGLSEFQGHQCAICGKDDVYRALDIDHSHNTGEVRGLLCTNCNTALGRFNDSIEGLEKALYYLKNTPFDEFKYTNAR
jgi:5-methylcytosine-specific restriction endonuclease McrA